MFPVGCYTCLFHALSVLPSVWDPLKFVILRSWFSCFLVLLHSRSLTEQPIKTKSERSFFFPPFVFNFFHLFYLFIFSTDGSRRLYLRHIPQRSPCLWVCRGILQARSGDSVGWRGHQSSVLAWGQLPSPCGPPRHHRTELERGVCLRSVRARARTSPSSAGQSAPESPVREPQSPAAINHNNVYTITNDYINCQFVVLHTCTQTLFHTPHIREMQEIFRRAHNSKRQNVIETFLVRSVGCKRDHVLRSFLSSPLVLSCLTTAVIGCFFCLAMAAGIWSNLNKKNKQLQLKTD